MEINPNVRDSHQQVNVAGVTALFATLATRSFCRTLLCEINAAALVDKCSLMRISTEPGVQVFGGETLSRESRASSATVAYIDRYHRFDPNRRLLAQGSKNRDAIVLQRQTAAQVGDRTYRRACYEEPGIIDRCRSSRATCAVGSSPSMRIARTDPASSAERTWRSLSRWRHFSRSRQPAISSCCCMQAMTRPCGVCD